MNKTTEFLFSLTVLESRSAKLSFRPGSDPSESSRGECSLASLQPLAVAAFLGFQLLLPVSASVVTWFSSLGVSEITVLSFLKGRQSYWI